MISSTGSGRAQPVDEVGGRVHRIVGHVVLQHLGEHTAGQLGFPWSGPGPQRVAVLG